MEGKMISAMGLFAFLAGVFFSTKESDRRFAVLYLFLGYFIFTMAVSIEVSAIKIVAAILQKSLQ